MPVATCGPDQPVVDCLPPSLRNQMLIDAHLPSDQAETRPAAPIELRDDLEHPLQRNWTQHP
jgi:hypothetical protein